MRLCSSFYFIYFVRIKVVITRDYWGVLEFSLTTSFSSFSFFSSSSSSSLSSFFFFPHFFFFFFLGIPRILSSPLFYLTEMISRTSNLVTLCLAAAHLLVLASCINSDAYVREGLISGGAAAERGIVSAVHPMVEVIPLYGTNNCDYGAKVTIGHQEVIIQNSLNTFIIYSRDKTCPHANSCQNVFV